MVRVLKSVVASALFAMVSIAQGASVDIDISGVVKAEDGKAILGAAVTLENAKLSAITDDNGSFSFKSTVGVSQNLSLFSRGMEVSAHKNGLSIYLATPSAVTVSAYSLQGKMLSKVEKNLGAGMNNLIIPTTKTKVSLYKVKTGNNELVLKSLSMGTYQLGAVNVNQSLSTTSTLEKKALVAADFADVLKVTKSGYQDFSMNIDNATMSGIAVELKVAQTNDLMLPQEGNPAIIQFDFYLTLIDKADIILSWQQKCGGWPKNNDYLASGKGGSDAGTFDNGATTAELTVMADAYNKTKNQKYLDAARSGMDFILNSQYPSGGWPQFYPLKGGYANHVTYNDDGMSRIMVLLQKAIDKAVPFGTDIFTESQRSKFQGALNKGIEYTLKAQIVQNGKKTAWCGQHNKDSYKPEGARAYEHPSIMTYESVKVIGFLMSQPQTPEIKAAAIAALEWFASPNTYVADHAYDKTKEETNPFIPTVGSRCWYRFYDIPTNKPIFSNYDGKIWNSIESYFKVPVADRKTGYRWGNMEAEVIIAYAKKVGYL